MTSRSNFEIIPVSLIEVANVKGSVFRDSFDKLQG